MNVIGMRIGKDPSRNRRNHRRLLNRLGQANGDPHIRVHQLLRDARVVLDDRMHVPLLHLPQLHRLVVRGEQEVGVVGAAAPGYPVDAFIDFERFQVVEFRLVGLEFRVKLVLTSGFLQTKSR